MLLDMKLFSKLMFFAASRSQREAILPSAPSPHNPVHTRAKKWVEDKAAEAQHAINILQPKHGATRERREETTGQLAAQSAPRVPWSNHSALVPENPQTPAAKVRNALRKKADPSIKSSPQVAKLRENVKVSPQYLCVQVADLVLRCKNRILCALVPPDLFSRQPSVLTVVNYVFWNGYCRLQQSLQLDGSQVGFHQLFPRHRKVQRKKQ
jgi:hypothetical protein